MLVRAVRVGVVAGHVLLPDQERAAKVMRVALETRHSLAVAVALRQLALMQLLAVSVVTAAQEFQVQLAGLLQTMAVVVAVVDQRLELAALVAVEAVQVRLV